jgi:hypothetical protein
MTPYDLCEGNLHHVFDELPTCTGDGGNFRGWSGMNPSA